MTEDSKEVLESQEKPANLPAESPAESAAAEPASPMASAPEPAQETAATAAASTERPGLISLAALENQSKASKPAAPRPTLQLGKLLAGKGWIIGIGAAVILIILLFLSPLSPGALLVQGNGYTTLNAENPTITHPDGLFVKIDPEQVKGLAVKLGSIPRAEFETGSQADLKTALETLPAGLKPKSPYYTINSSGKQIGPTTLEVIIPNDAEPWETLDLYAWDGQAWQWIPSTLDRAQEHLVAQMDALPTSLMVMQTEPIPQTVVGEGEALPAQDVSTALTEADLIGMKISTLGNLIGNADQLPKAAEGSTLQLAPTVRNWVPGREPNPGLVNDMLSIETDRNTHIQNLVALVANNGYKGLVLDYRGLKAEQRDAYSTFVQALGAALHEKQAWLAVTVDTPVQNGTAWETAGYDWAALGKAADQIRFPMPADPAAYAAGGTVEQLLSWATGQVNRYKLYPIYSTLSTDGQQTVAFTDLLGTAAAIQTAQPLTDTLQPGTPVALQITGSPSVATDAATGAATLSMGDKKVWLGTPQWLRTRLDLTNRYHLGGVLLRDLADPRNMPGILAAVNEFKTQAPAGEYAMPEITWQITSPNGQATEVKTTLDQPQLAWTAPQISGTYQIAANVMGVSRGTLALQVGVPMTTTTATSPTTTTTPGATANALATPPPSDTMTGAFVADVTVPDNTRFQKGEKFTKTWRMQNTGSTAWPEETYAILATGDAMGAQAKIKVGAVQPGKTIDVNVDMVAPAADGTYQAQWQLIAKDATISGSGMTILINVGDPQPTPTPGATAPTPIKPVSGGAFELGGHILQGFQAADKMHYAGMNWAKVQVRYPGDAAGIIAAAHANGFKIQISALGDSGMVTQGGFDDTVANWVGGIAAAGADAIEVWNEPNLPREWASGSISPQAYTNLLCKAYAAIKAKNPGTAVISAAPAPTGYFGGCRGEGCDDLPWLQNMYNAGAANCMDYIGAHHNAGATAPAATSGHPADSGGRHHSWYFLPQTQLYYNTFGGTRKLFYTELGYVSPDGYPPIPDTFAWGAGTSVAEQAQWLAEVVSLSSQTGMVRVVIVWNVDANCYGMCGGVNDPQAGYAILRPDGSCPACDSLHALLGTR